MKWEDLLSFFFFVSKNISPPPALCFSHSPQLILHPPPRLDFLHYPLVYSGYSFTHTHIYTHYFFFCMACMGDRDGGRSTNKHGQAHTHRETKANKQQAQRGVCPLKVLFRPSILPILIFCSRLFPSHAPLFRAHYRHPHIDITHTHTHSARNQKTHIPPQFPSFSHTSHHINIPSILPLLGEAKKKVSLF